MILVMDSKSPNTNEKDAGLVTIERMYNRATRRKEKFWLATKRANTILKPSRRERQRHKKNSLNGGDPPTMHSRKTLPDPLEKKSNELTTFLTLMYTKSITVCHTELGEHGYVIRFRLGPNKYDRTLFVNLATGVTFRPQGQIRQVLEMDSECAPSINFTVRLLRELNKTTDETEAFLKLTRKAHCG